MKELDGVYANYFEIEDCEEITDEICSFHKRLAELDLKIIKDVEVSYFIANTDNNKHVTENISFKEFQYRLINDKKFQLVFYCDLEGEDYAIRQIGPEVWVRSFDKKKANLIYNMIK